MGHEDFVELREITHAEYIRIAALECAVRSYQGRGVYDRSVVNAAQIFENYIREGR